MPYYPPVTVTSGGGGGSSVSGSATIDFGAAPGTNVIFTTVTGQTSITPSTKVNVWTGSTSVDHTDMEHAIVDLKHIVNAIVTGTSFTILSVSPTMRLTGQWTVNWSY